ncbi:LacI family DNA-binding transcriptional regulator [Sulfitobacter sp. F26169L]|uniref:LacI family DNA-binding transcriptional regulator n=1 Tax=Sulfitobacter sp. F26169L TaxID=2996015 RepID=UPI002260C793|nr:LacI family DNA-binding transcriptional regulator [Sulfitobacter sp. F26169L]MCX7566367.1 LacI family DNA-binding transcriptional regulator [Sulfitobacter sp. F26169L]
MRSSRSFPTLEDVAKAAGVSTATVSRCLNTPDRVIKPTREKVMKAVDALGYTPNFGARVMAAKRTFTIGAIIPTMENAIFARGLQAFQEELHRHGYTLLVSSTAYRPELEEEQIRALVARGADGLLLIGYDRDPALNAYLHQRAIPTLIAWAFKPEIPKPAIGFDNRAAMARLTREVLAQGHRRIGVISGIAKGNDRAAERLAGFAEALGATGLDLRDMPVIETPYGFENGENAMIRLMQTDARPTAVMCGNDVLAAGALRGARALGLAVPQDVSVTGFDDIELARIVTPPLTTVHVPHREMGTKAAIALIALVEGGDSLPPTDLGVSIKRRESLGPATPRDEQAG